MHHVLREEAIREVVQTYETVAEHYRLPSVHVGRFLMDRVAQGRVSFRGEGGREPILRDECHPLPVGNQMIVTLIADAVRRFLRDDPREWVKDPPALTSHPMVGGRIEPVEDAMVRGAFERHRRSVGNIAQAVSWHSLPEGSRLEFRPRGAFAGMYVVVGPRSGMIEARIGSRVVRRSLFDRWCSYERISTCILSESPDDLGVRDCEVSIELMSEAPDYSVCPKLTGLPEGRTLDIAGLFLL
jgi:hypothetical protein